VLRGSRSSVELNDRKDATVPNADVAQAMSRASWATARKSPIENPKDIGPANTTSLSLSAKFEMRLPDPRIVRFQGQANTHAAGSDRQGDRYKYRRALFCTLASK
jgi:hypothetical protein